MNQTDNPASGRTGRARDRMSPRITKYSGIARARLVAALFFFGAAAMALLTMTVDRSFAAKSAGCDGGGVTLLGLSGDQKGTVPASLGPSSCLVQGKYVEVPVGAATLRVCAQN